MRALKIIFLLTLASAGANTIGLLFSNFNTAIKFNTLLSSVNGMQELFDTTANIRMYINYTAFSLISIVSTLYNWPILKFLYKRDAHFSREYHVKIKRRTINMPLVLSLFAALPWIIGPVIIHFNASDNPFTIHIITTSLTAGAVTIIANYLLLDMILRFYLMRYIFPEGKLRGVQGSYRIKLSSRMLLFAAAISILPLIAYHEYLLGALLQVNHGIDGKTVITEFTNNSRYLLIAFILIALGLTFTLSRSFSSPLVNMEKMTACIEEEDYSKRVKVVSNDEIGVLGDSMNMMMDGLKDKARILTEFGRIVDPAVRDYILKDESRLAGQQKNVVVLFSDIRSFTTLSENMPPEQVFDLLNRHFTNLSGIISGFDGYVDKFIGDAVMAVFGLFDDHDLSFHAVNAVRACVAIREKQALFNQTLAAENKTAVNIGMGLHAGEVLAGKLGSEDRHDYTVIGDTVNVASRVESLCKKLDTDILITGEVFKLCSNEFQSLESLKVRVKGREEPVVLHKI
ncbi:MAG: HAMP domain-containing protein [bacterium]|nr:HAMP domain-containing protein [bacterium]